MKLPSLLDLLAFALPLHDWGYIASSHAPCEFGSSSEDNLRKEGLSGFPHWRLATAAVGLVWSHYIVENEKCVTSCVVIIYVSVSTTRKSWFQCSVQLRAFQKCPYRNNRLFLHLRIPSNLIAISVKCRMTVRFVFYHLNQILVWNGRPILRLGSMGIHFWGF